MRTSIIGWVVISTFGLWAVASILAQFPGKLQDVLVRWDLLGLMPRWTFFAPIPATSDFHVLYRDQVDDGRFTPWTEVTIAEPRHAWHVIWNPGKRRKKALFDVTILLAKEVTIVHQRGGDLAVAHLSVAYLDLLTFISGLPRLPGLRATQFLLMETYGEGSDKEPAVILLSSKHALRADNELTG